MFFIDFGGGLVYICKLENLELLPRLNSRALEIGGL